VQLIAVPAEVAGELVGCHVCLAEQDRITTPAREEFAHVAQGGVGIFGRLAGDAVGLDQEWRRVDAEAGEAQLHPESHDLLQLGPHAWVLDVQVGLELVEAMQVVLTGGLVQLPVGGLLAREDVHAVDDRVFPPQVAGDPSPHALLPPLRHVAGRSYGRRLLEGYLATRAANQGFEPAGPVQLGEVV